MRRSIFPSISPRRRREPSVAASPNTRKRMILLKMLYLKCLSWSLDSQRTRLLPTMNAWIQHLKGGLLIALMMPRCNFALKKCIFEDRVAEKFNSSGFCSSDCQAISVFSLRFQFQT